MAKPYFSPAKPPKMHQKEELTSDPLHLHRSRLNTARRRERRTMDEYITPNYKTIGTVEQRKIRELYTSSLLNAFTQQDYLDAIALIGRVIDRLEKLEK